jgi:hypothetical protein
VNQFSARKSSKMLVYIRASFDDAGMRRIFDPGSLRLYFKNIDKSVLLALQIPREKGQDYLFHPVHDMVRVVAVVYLKYRWNAVPV